MKSFSKSDINYNKIQQHLPCVYVAGESKGNGDGGKTGSATRMVTRLRNPDSKLSQRKVMQDKDASSQDSKALKEVKS